MPFLPAPDQPEASRSRTGVLGVVAAALLPTYGARRNAAGALEALISSAPVRRAAAAGDGEHASAGSTEVPGYEVVAEPRPAAGPR